MIFAGVPQPPTDMVMPHTAQIWFTVFIGLPFAAVVVLAVRELAIRRDPLLVLCLLGGGLAMFLEPVVHVLGLCYVPRQGQWTVFETLGRPIPLLMVFVYPWYVGGQGYLCARRFERGITRRDVFRLWLLFMAVNAAVETPGLWADFYTYYGKQPFDFWGFPLWWAFVNGVMPIALGAAIVRLRPHLRGAGLLGIALLVPMVDGAVNGAIAWPVWATLNTSLPSVVTWTAGVATLALASYAVWMISLVVASGGGAGAAKLLVRDAGATPTRK